MNRNGLIRELENFKYDYICLEDRMNEIEIMSEKIKKTYNRLQFFKKLSSDNTELDKTLASIVKSHNAKEKNILNIINKKQQIENRIDALSQPYKSIFYMKYINFKTIDEISYELGYSSKRIYQLHKEGVDLYCKLYGNTKL